MNGILSELSESFNFISCLAEGYEGYSRGPKNTAFNSRNRSFLKKIVRFLRIKIGFLSNTIYRRKIKLCLKKNMQKDYNAENFLTVIDIASFLNVRPSTIYQWTSLGGLPHYRFGRLLRFKRREVEAWAEKWRSKGIDINGKSRLNLKSPERKKLDIEQIIKRSIESVRGNLYNFSRGNPDQSRGLGKEVKDGDLS